MGPKNTPIVSPELCIHAGEGAAHDVGAHVFQALSPEYAGARRAGDAGLVRRIGHGYAVVGWVDEARAVERYIE